MEYFPAKQQLIHYLQLSWRAQSSHTLTYNQIEQAINMNIEFNRILCSADKDVVEFFSYIMTSPASYLKAEKLCRGDP